ncbi:PREDICTED: uncharacterized protein LOC109328214 isoform X1 [Lupinus angustifolius]|uniref:uncharacterized protein LOC109328214 isoform X1 n=1 Tax=Lupinus angustifolius TaxID=3871 RepID=UPI00092F4648|nr:PREDICTED: uncharacterized protein LOC109328214 isoform X1 [Lupinus angustifolius]
MKLSAFCALFFVVGASLVFVTFSTSILHASWFPDLFATNYGERRTVIALGRKLKESGRGISSSYKGNMGSVTLDDYNPSNPMPDAKNYVKGGTIEHDQPIGPYKPQPMPPHGDGDES